MQMQMQHMMQQQPSNGMAAGANDGKNRRGKNKKNRGAEGGKGKGGKGARGAPANKQRAQLAAGPAEGGSILGLLQAEMRPGAVTADSSDS